MQAGVPGSGEFALHASTAFAIELGVERPIPEWGGQRVSILLEDEAHFDGSRVHWLDGRQDERTVLR